MLETRDDDDPDRPALELVADEAQRVQRIVRQLLDFSRHQAGEVREVALNPLVERMLSLAQLDLGKRQIEVELNLAPDLPPVVADEQQLEQVFVNLLTNAAHAMNSGGTLQITSGHDAAVVFVELRDTGVGIAPADLERIFDPFFTTKDPGEGTGLGLSVSHRIVSAQGGQIDVESELGRGTTFRVVLPRAPGGEPAEAAS